MKRTPTIVRILITFVVLSLALLIYSKVEPKPLPQIKNPWSYLDHFASELENRKLELEMGEILKQHEGPYYVSLLRTSEIGAADDIAFYVLRVVPTRDIPIYKGWLEAGLEFGLVDTQAQSPYGSIQLVAMKKLKITLE